MTIDGNISMNTRTGSPQLMWNNVETTEDIKVRIRSNTGAIEVQINQDQPLFSDVDFILDNSVGKISLDIDIQGSVGAELISDADVGDVNVESSNGFSFTTSEHLRSDNYLGVHNFNISMNNDVGRIGINAVYSPS